MYRGRHGVLRLISDHNAFRRCSLDNLTDRRGGNFVITMDDERSYQAALIRLSEGIELTFNRKEFLLIELVGFSCPLGTPSNTARAGDESRDDRSW